MAISVNADAKLRFLRGLETNLPTAMTDGYVYVTTDTRAMYVDYKGADGNLARIRIGDVLTVANVAALPVIANAKDGVLYYCLAENILCTPYGTGAGRDWKQINKQKTLSETIGEMTFTAAAVTDGANMTIKMSSGGQTKDASLGVASGENVKVSVANDKVTIGAKDTTITGAITTGARETGGVAINLTNTTGGTDADGTELTGSVSGGSIGIVGSGVTVSQADNVVTIGGKVAVANAFAADGAFTTKITHADNSTATSTAVTPKVKYGASGAKEAIFASGTATLNVYSKDEVDDAIAAQLKAANAMTFKGTMGATGATVKELPDTAALGDTYIVNDNGDYSYKAVGATAAKSQSCRIGDMFIAGPGDEGADGLLKTLVWTYVPAGNDDLPIVSATATTSNITFKSTLGNQVSTVGAVAVGDGMKAAATGTTFTIAHGDVETAAPTTGTAVAQAPGTSGDKAATYTAITGVTIENGHVTGYETTKLTVVDTALASASLTAAAVANGGATVTLNVKDTANNSKGNAITVKTSGNSAAYVSVDESKAIVIDTVWGTF